MVHFTRVKALWPEQKGFHLKRPDTGDEYIFLHLLTPCEIVIDGVPVKTGEGACILYNKHDRQEFSSHDCGLLHDYFHASGNIEDLLAAYNVRCGTLYYPQLHERITAIIQKIEQEQLKKSPFFEEYCSALLSELLILLSRSHNARDGSEVQDNRMYDRFIALRKEIHERFDSGLTVDMMAQMVNLSPSRFHSVYKDIFGISPKKDYLNIRIEHAKTLLLQGKYPIAKVAAMAGYNNPYHFIRQFKKITGKTPGKYQKEAKNDSESN